MTASTMGSPTPPRRKGEVRPLQGTPRGSAAELPGKHPVPHVQGVDLGRPTLEETIGKPPGGGPHVHATSPHSRSRRPARAPLSLSRRGLHRTGLPPRRTPHCFRTAIPGLVNRRVHQDRSREDQGLA